MWKVVFGLLLCHWYFFPSIHLTITFCQPFPETTVRDFYEDGSYIEWDIQSRFNDTLSEFVSEFQMMFRTRQSNGMLFMATSFSTLEHLQIEVHSLQC